jgi:hypothetical protein
LPQQCVHVCLGVHYDAEHLQTLCIKLLAGQRGTSGMVLHGAPTSGMVLHGAPTSGMVLHGAPTSDMVLHVAPTFWQRRQHVSHVLRR